MSNSLLVIARVRRAMPHNADVMFLCDELERLLAPAELKPALSSEAAPKPGFDKRSYQREYMRKRRAG